MNVLQVHADNFGKGGISQVIWRLMIEMQKKEIVFSYLTSRDNIPVKYKQIIEENAGKIILLDKVSGNVLKRLINKYKSLKEILKSNSFHLIHINGNDMLGVFLYIKAAKKVGIKVIIHAHTTKFSSNNKVYLGLRQILNKILRLLYLRKVDCMFACSTEAAKFMYGKAADKAVIIKNGLEPDKYMFDITAREEIRNEMKANDKIIIGHIGRFVYPKNHEFILDVFERINREYSNVELWLIGEKDGEGFRRIYGKVIQCGLQDTVKFIGSTDKIKEYLSAMDVLLFPSRFEGLPLVLVEAQTNGLPVVCSSVITDETVFSKNVEKISLDDPMEKWADKLMQFGNVPRESLSYHEIVESGFDISKIADVVLEEYKKLKVW